MLGEFEASAADRRRIKSLIDGRIEWPGELEGVLTERSGKHIGAFVAVLGDPKTLVFTGGMRRLSLDSRILVSSSIQYGMRPARQSSPQTTRASSCA